MLFQLHRLYTVIRSIKVYYSLQIMRNKAVVTCFEIIIHDLIGGINENYMSVTFVFGPGIPQPWTSQIRSMRTSHLTTTFGVTVD